MLGDTVLVYNGIYSGFKTVRSGTFFHPIIFRASYNNVVINRANDRDNILISKTDYIIIDGFEVQVLNNITAGSREQPIIDKNRAGNYIDSHSNFMQRSDTELFINPEEGDYRLSSTSPAIDRAAVSYRDRNAPTLDIEANSRPRGSGCDIGAYEF